ncbi:MAG: FAD-dependent oxidoreductase [Peptoniphilaceae bacterium]|nr:FAD-dependent oxidoreductase [Peptoniphilaceae bacterium]MDD7383682.1 FAD-dependent oxidoreductase [Peptoniphilaceae bacterium]MDY3738779.1 FAD-dependent oxidoreductase [Peptoniphilaceae bacterium]
MSEKYDLIIVGSGPAGMTAAIYGVRANLSVLMLDKLSPGGNIINTNEIENYPGAGKINGAELALKMFEDTQNLGAKFEYATVNKIEDGEYKKVYTDEFDEPFEALCVIIATGTRPRTLNIPGEAELAGRNVSWCAICDGAKYRGKDVVVCGGGNSAIDEGTYLAGICNNLTIITDFDLTGDPTSAEYLRSLPNVKVKPYKTISEFIMEDNHLKGVRFADKDTLENEEIVNTDGVFEYIGALPNTEFIKDSEIENDRGYIITDSHMRTNIPGIFAAGDCISKGLRQVVTATNDGAIAAQEARAYKMSKNVNDAK